MPLCLQNFTQRASEGWGSFCDEIDPTHDHAPRSTPTIPSVK